MDKLHLRRHSCWRVRRALKNEIIGNTDKSGALLTVAVYAALSDGWKTDEEREWLRDLAWELGVEDVCRQRASAGGFFLQLRHLGFT